MNSSKAARSVSRQQKVGDALRQDTRNRLLEAAAAEFPVHGYAATTVTRLAAAAGVSVQTLYLAWGSKRALLRAYMERAIAGDVAFGALTEGLSLAKAIDTAWVIASPESYDLLVRRLGYTLAEFRVWIENTLSAAILASSK